jgi:hypothetical protein
MYQVFNDKGALIATYQNRSEVLTFLAASVPEDVDHDESEDGEPTGEYFNKDGLLLFKVVKQQQ